MKLVFYGKIGETRAFHYLHGIHIFQHLRLAYLVVFLYVFIVTNILGHV